MSCYVVEYMSCFVREQKKHVMLYHICVMVCVMFVMLHNMCHVIEQKKKNMLCYITCELTSYLI